MIQPGDVLVVRTPATTWRHRIAGRLIRFGAALRDQANLNDHVIVAHHADTAGTLWAIEARPGGVGWVDVAELAEGHLLSNVDQPKTDVQRQQVCAAAEGLLGVGYDWAAIGMDVVEALSLERLWRDHPWGDRPPAHIVCSALASWTYARAGLAGPAAPWRTTTPGDWSEFVLTRGWEQ